MPSPAGGSGISPGPGWSPPRGNPVWGGFSGASRLPPQSEGVSDERRQAPHTAVVGATAEDSSYVPLRSWSTTAAGIL